MTDVKTKATFKVRVTGEHRTGWCENCGTRVVKEFYMDGERKRVHAVCPVCGGLGRLIAKTFSVQPPESPRCTRPKCLYRFFKDILLCALLSYYHQKRVIYVEKHRNRNIPERYRTGEPSPENIWQAVLTILKLKCISIF